MKFKLVAILLIVLHLALLLKLQFTAWPEMLSYPYLLKYGFNLYKDIALPYQPLLPLMLSIVYKFLGFNLFSLQLFTYFLIVLSDILIFLISLKLIGKRWRVIIPLGLYVFIQSFTDGNMLWFDLATVPFLLIGILFLISYEGLKKYFWFGFFLSLAFFIKQQTGILYFFIILFFILSKRFKVIFYILFGSALPALFIITYILLNGTLKDYFFWTAAVPLFWYPKFPGYTGLPSNKDIFIIAFLFLPGFFSILLNFKKIKPNALIFLTFFGAFLAAFPRFGYFRLQPAVALYFVLLAIILSKEKDKFIIFYLIPFFISIVLLFKINQSSFNLSARFYGQEDFILSKKIYEITKPEDKIYILGKSSTLYVLTNKLPPKPWVDNYVWYMEIEGVQSKLLKGLISDPPEFIFRKIPEEGNWYDLGVYQPNKIVDFIKQNYTESGMIEDIEIWRKK